ncbi:MAG: alkaline phosphatase family protein, partial [Acidobacteriaceae bacterium]
LSATGGTQSVSPTKTTTYTATATGPGGKSSQTTTITVNAKSAPTVAISAKPASITTGSSSLLTVTATNATGVVVTGSDGSTYTLTASGGTQAVSPKTTTIYTATATGAGGKISATATVTVTPIPLPTVTISANPASITSGNSSVLTVTATGATQVTISGTDGSKYTLGSSGGTQSVSPTTTTTYTATATGAGGTTTSAATVTVTPAPAPTVTITANPTSISAGSSSTLTVTATNATSVVVTGSDSSSYTLAASGGTQVVTPKSTTTYTATATGAAGKVTATAKVTVITGSAVQLTVNNVGTGSGTVTSAPAGINCPQACTASFSKGAAVVLTATPESGSTFAGWSGACTGLETCNLTLATNTAVTATFEQGTAGLNSIQHIIFFAQENRSLDNYFGAMREYWKQNGIPDQSFDGLPQFNPTSGLAPLYGPPPAIPGCDPTSPYPAACVWDTSNLVASFHMISVCNENTSPSWQEAHNDWDYTDPVGTRPSKNNGFVHTAAGDARDNPGHPFYDTDGIRAMGYWDGTDMNYDYFMASNFATSDRFFQPAMSRTEINREYIDAATSGGYALPNGSDPADTPQLKSPVIWEELVKAGISWKIYINPEGTGCAGPPYQASCLIQQAYLEGFTYATLILEKYPQNIVPISQYFSDLQNGTLPQVAEIEPASDAALDQHGSVSDANPTNVQAGARFTSTLINALMNSSSWEDSAFIFTFDESGGLYDHVAPQPTVSPDGIPPIDLKPGYICTTVTGPTCNFTYTGYRIPMYVVSPYAKKNYVSHTVMDTTAWLKLVEERFNLPPLNARDAAQPDMSEFFDFNNPPWMSPPAPPAQRVSNPCYLNKVP